MDVSVWGKGKGAKALAKALGCRRNKPARFVIRWGTVEPISGFKHVEINPASAIKRASHKYMSLTTMRTAGVSVPKANTSPDGVPFPMLARKNYHTKGSDVIFLEKWPRGGVNRDYFVAYLRPDKEYRYHVALGKVILPTVKIKRGETGRSLYSDESIIRNHEADGWAQVVTDKVRKSLEEQAIRAVEAHGLHFGAVDIITHKKRPYVLEVNTAPGMKVPNRVEAYRKAIQAWMQTNA